jgi:hypothetical protein
MNNGIITRRPRLNPTDSHSLSKTEASGANTSDTTYPLMKRKKPPYAEVATIINGV